MSLFIQFGFRKWKSHVTERPFEVRSEVVKELYSELNVIKAHPGTSVIYQCILHTYLSVTIILRHELNSFGKINTFNNKLILTASMHVVKLAMSVIVIIAGSLISCGNVLYVFIFGWWLALVYILVSLLMFSTVIGIPYGQFKPLSS